MAQLSSCPLDSPEDLGELSNEDRLAALALGRTVAFLGYSVLAAVPVAAIAFLVPTRRLGEALQGAIVVGAFVLIETVLVVAVARGALPGTRPVRIQAFSEAQLSLGLTLLSAGTWILTGSSQEGQILQVVCNGGMLLGIAVYFVAKSSLAGQLRWPVLGIGVLPALQLYWELGRRAV